MNMEMINRLSTTEKLASGISACIAAALALLICLKQTIAPSYADFIVGNITWQDTTKFQDLIAVPVFITVLLFVFMFLSFQLDKLKQQYGKDYSTDLCNQLVWWSIPSLASVFGLILETAIDNNVFYISGIGTIFVLVVSVCSASRKININPKLIGLTALGIILISLVPLEIALLLGRAPINFAGDINLIRYKKLTYFLGGLGIIAGLFYFIFFPRKILQIFPKLILLAQVGLPVFFITLYPARLLLNSGELIKYQTTIWLKILLVGIILFGLFDVVNRYRKYANTTEWANLLSPVALFALLIGLRAGVTVGPSISPDDYHFGESLLGWWSYLHGVVPYVEYFPAHGFIGDDLTQFFSFIFFDGSAGSMAEAGRLGFAVLAFATFISIYLYAGSIGLAFISTYFVGGLLNWLFLTPFICLWCNSILRKNPSKWMSVWLLSVPVVILGVPPQGLLLVAASGVIAANFAWRMIRNPKERIWPHIGISLTIIIVFGLVTPLLPMLFGAIRYVLENGPINQVAYGVSWALSWNNGVKAGFIFEAIRMSWVVIPIACLMIFFASIKAHGYQKELHLPALTICIFVLLLIPYSMGRIDPGSMSRPGIVAIFGWAILLPIAAWDVIKYSNRIWLILIAACMSAALHVPPLSFSNLVLATSSKIAAGPLRDGASADLYNIGNSYVQDEHWDRLTKLNALLKAKLSPSETYLDLSSRNAQYFYLNRRPVTAVTAPYNMVSPAQQKRVVEQLSKNLPKLALLESSNITHDGGGLPLRNPYLYRFIVENYIPRFDDGFIVGDRINKNFNVRDITINISIKNITDANWHRGVHLSESAVVINDPIFFPFIRIGDYVRFGNSEPRKIIKIFSEGSALWFEGNPLDPALTGYPNKVNVVVEPQVASEYRASLFQKAFSISDFQKIPLSWGRSEKSLKNKMTLTSNLDKISPSFGHIIPENGKYKVNGSDPLLSFDISDLNLSGRDTGLLRFDFSCSDQSAEPRIQIFWWGDDRSEPFEMSSIKFTAGNGTLITPLDASPLWLTMKHVKGIRIDLDNPTACSSFSVKNIGLFQRVF